jgi:hypothetical protein
MPKGTVCLEFPIQQPSRVPTIITRKSLTVWSQKMDHQKAERVAYKIGIQNFQSFGLAKTGLSETQRLVSIQPLFCPEKISAA